MFSQVLISWDWIGLELNAEKCTSVLWWVLVIEPGSLDQNLGSILTGMLSFLEFCFLRFHAVVVITKGTIRDVKLLSFIFFFVSKDVDSYRRFAVRAFATVLCCTDGHLVSALRLFATKDGLQRLYESPCFITKRKTEDHGLTPG